MKTLMSLIPNLNEKSKLLVGQLKLKGHEKNFNLSKYIFACTLDITCGESVKWRLDLFTF